MTTFPDQILLKINRPQAIDDIEKLCKFQKNQSTIEDCIA